MSSSRPAEAPELTGAAGSALPYEPSVPCSQCSRGLDPLRAACVSITERGVCFFCSRSCRTTFRQHAAAAHEEAAPELPEPRPATSFPPIARRGARPVLRTPVAPLALGALFLLLSLGDEWLLRQLGALGLLGCAAFLAQRSVHVRKASNALVGLVGPLGVAFLLLDALLQRERAPLVAAALGVGLLWHRERRLEHAHVEVALAEEEQRARLPRLVRKAQSRGAPTSLVELPLSALVAGDEVWVEAPDVVPVDGVVSEGAGELLPHAAARSPLRREVGSSVLAGSELVRGSLKVRATRPRREGARFQPFTSLDEPRGTQRWPALVEAARRPWGVGLAFGLSLLLASSLAGRELAAWGAALLSLPFSALAHRSRHLVRATLVRALASGIAFRDVAALERAARVRTLLLRAEGALIERDYELVSVVPLTDAPGPRQLLAWAASAESIAPDHPIARAVRARAAELGVTLPLLRRLVHVDGEGVTGSSESEGALVLGSRMALLKRGVAVAIADREAREAEARGHRVLFLALGDHLRGLLIFSQRLRAEARTAVQRLFDLGIDIELLSSDHRGSAEAIARPLDLTRIKAELSEPQRRAELTRLVNDEAELAVLGQLPHDRELFDESPLAIALDSAGADHHYAIATSSNDLGEAAFALELARASRRARGRAWALGVAGLLVSTLAAAGLLAPHFALTLALAVDLACLRSEGMTTRLRSQAG